MSGQPPPPPAGPGAAPGGAQGDGQAARLDKVEAEQARQGGMLETILHRVSGGAQGQPPAGPGGQAPAGDAASIAAQVRKEIAEADQRRKAEEDDKTWREGVTQTVEQLKAEQAPRDPEKGLRGLLQRAIGAGRLWAGLKRRT